VSKARARFSWIAINLALGLPLLLFAYSFFFIRYLADDFCVIGISLNRGPLYALGYWYQVWTGRYTYTLSSALAGQVGIGAAPLIALIIFGMWWLGLWNLFRAALHNRQLPHHTLIAASGASLVIAMALTATPSAAQNGYWQTGLLTYPPCLMLTAWLGYWLIRPPTSRFAQCGLAFLIPFVAAGYSDGFAVIQVTVLALGGMYLWWKWRGAFRQSSQFGMVVVALMGSIVGFIVVLVSPGNAVRRAMFPPADLVQTIVGTLANSFTPLLSMLILVPGTLFTLIALPTWAAQQDRQPAPRQLALNGFVVPCVLILLTVWAGFAASYFATTFPLPQRSWVIAQGVAAVCLMIFGYALGLRYQQAFRCSVVQRILTAFLTVSIVLSTIGVTLAGVREVRTAQEIAALWDKRDQAIRQQAGQNIPVRTFSLGLPLGLEDLTDDPNFWVNGCMANYYRVPSLTASEFVR
jgi:hypothetical protein